MKPQVDSLTSTTVQHVRIFDNREDFGLRWSAAATPLFEHGQNYQSGVELCFPPQSQKLGCGYATLHLCGKLLPADDA
jgi:hypothetical protein